MALRSTYTSAILAPQVSFAFLRAEVLFVASAVLATFACGGSHPPSQHETGATGGVGTGATTSNGGGSGAQAGGGGTGGTPPATGGAGTANGGASGASGSATAGASGTGGSASGGFAGTPTAGMAGTAEPGGAAGTAGGAGVAGAGGSAGAAGVAGAGAGGAPMGGDAGMGGSASGSAGAGNVNAVVTDDFEAGMLDTAKWELGFTGQGSIAVTTEEKHGGNQSVKVVGMSGPVMFVNKTVFPLPNGVLHFRVWMRFTSADWENHIAFVAASPGSQDQEVRFGGQANAYHANLAADGDGLSPDPFEYPSCALCLAPVADQWACLRGKLDFSNSDAQLYVDDTLAVDAQDASDWHAGTGMLPQDPTQIGFGWAIYGGAMNTVYYDDIAIGYEPIPCE